MELVNRLKVYAAAMAAASRLTQAEMDEIISGKEG